MTYQENKKLLLNDLPRILNIFVVYLLVFSLFDWFKLVAECEEEHRVPVDRRLQEAPPRRADQEGRH